MASMVAKFSGSDCMEPTLLVLDKVSRKKRKFRAEILQSDVTKNDSLENYFPRQFPVEELERIPSHCEKGVCKVCGDCDPVSAELELGVPGKIKEESSLCVPERGDWNKSAESELRKLVLSVLDATLKSAVKKIVDCGYSEKVAMKAIMRPGICYGSKDTLSNIVDNSLSFLQASQDMEQSIRYRFKYLDQLKEYLLAEFVFALQAVRPIFSPAEALWYLLFFDLDVSHACFVIGGQYKPVEDGNTSERSSMSTQNQLNALAETLDLNIPASSLSIQPKLPPPDPSLKGHETFTFTAQDTKDSKKGKTRFTINVADQFVAAAVTPQKFIAEEKLCHRKPHSLSNLKNVSTFGQKWIHVDVGKGKRNRGLKDTVKTGRMSSWKSVRVRRTNCSIFPLPEVTCTASFSAYEAEHSFSPGLKKEPILASLGSKYNEYSTEEIKGQPAISRDLDTEVIFKLTARSQIWQNNLNEWSEWANTKVLQATRRLLKNKPELNKLRQEKAETDRLEQERKSLKQNITKKLTELGNAVYKTSGKVNVANSAIQRLETENASLRQEMELAKLQAAKSAANFQEAFVKEKERLITVQTYVKQKGFFQDDLNAEKLKLAEVQLELRKATVSLSLLEDKWSKEEKAKQELARQSISIRDETEQLKVSGKLKEEAINSKTASTLQKYEDHMQELRTEISKLKMKSDSNSIAVLKRGIHESQVTGFRKSQTELAVHTTYSKSCVMRHRECVMCLEEEMSVVFLPCAHQVLCTKCNAQHKMNGFKDCPSCRSTISQRIGVRYAYAIP